jgi:3-oxoacyl-[acyl-carrier protein] reductase
MNPLGKRVAIVTGGSRGIGLGICEAFVSEGIAVAMVYRDDEKAAQVAETALRESGGTVMTVKADVGLAVEAARSVDDVVSKWGRVDILVNNAGVFRFSFIEDMDEDFFDSIVKVNLKGTIFMIKSALPWLKKSGHGRIVNASSISSRLADVGLVAYGCSKAGVDMLTRIAAAELAPFSITVNAYAPGIIATEMTREMIEARGEEQLKQIPAGKFGASADVANLVKYLCSLESDYISGEVIGIDGGMLKVQNPARARR